MAKTRREKEDILEKLKENLDEQRGIYFVGFKGLGGADLFRLRRRLERADALFYVVKKTLARRALAEEGVEIPDDFWEGQVALTFIFGEEVEPARAVYEQEELEIRGGVLEGEVLSSARIEELAQLPTSEELERRLVGSLRAPLFGLRSSLENNVKGLLLILNAQAS